MEKAFNCVSRLKYALQLKEVDRPPVTSLMTGVTVDLMEKSGVNWPDAHTEADLMVTLSAAAYEFYGLESLKLPFDMAVEAEALGGEVDFGNLDTLPQLKGHLFEEPEEVRFDRDILKKGRIPLVLKAIGEAKKRYDNFIPVVSSIVGPFTLGTRLFGFEKFLTWLVLEPEKVKAALEKITDLCVMYAREQVYAGSDVIQVGEAASSGDLIPGDAYGEFIAPCHKRLCSELGIPAVVHICGNITGHLKYIPDTGMAGISLDERTDIEKAKSILKGKTAIVGYVPTLEILLNGSPEEVYKKSVECIENGVDLLNAGCAWPPHVKGENVKAMVRAAAERGK